MNMNTNMNIKNKDNYVDDYENKGMTMTEFYSILIITMLIFTLMGITYIIKAFNTLFNYLHI